VRIQHQIDRVVLDGLALDRADARRLDAALKVELARLLAGSGAGPLLRTAGASSAVERMSTPPVRVSDAAQLGRDVARSLHGGLLGDPPGR
jgi:hypothetical protein